MTPTPAQRKRALKKARRESTNPAHNPALVMVICDECRAVQPNRRSKRRDGAPSHCARCLHPFGTYA